MKPGQMAVCPDTTRTVVERDVLGEQHDATLGGVVDAAARGALEALDAGERHDRAALPVNPRLLDHLGQRRLGHQEGGREVDRDHPVPLGLFEQVDRAATGDARGVDDTVESVRHGGEESADRGLVGHVGRHEREPLAEVGWCSQVGADDGAPFGEQALGGGKADARRRPRHNECARTCAAINFGHDAAFVMAITLTAARRIYGGTNWRPQLVHIE